MRRIATSSAVTACACLLSMPVGTGHIGEPSDTLPNAGVVSPRFELSYHRGRLHLDGHTLSVGHEQRLAEAAARLFGDRETTFRPLGVVPDYWPQSTLQLLAAVAGTRSSKAVLTDSSLTLRGVAADGWPLQLDALRSVLPDSIDLSVNVTTLDAEIDIGKLCARAVSAFEPGPANFEESGTILRNSAYPVLDRVVALADTCRNSQIAITGHSDSSGNENWNRQLSLARAATVADYFAARGIAEDRLLVEGLGSVIPVADNGTRYGRSLNRRIDIRLRPRGPLTR